MIIRVIPPSTPPITAPTGISSFLLYNTNNHASHALPKSFF